MIRFCFCDIERGIGRPVIGVAPGAALPRTPPVSNRESRRGPYRIAVAGDVGGRRQRLVFGTQVIEARVHEFLLEGHVAHHALALGILDVVIVVVNEMASKTPKHRAPGRERPDRAAEFQPLLVVDFDFLVILAVVHADVDIAVIRWDVVMERGTRIRGRHRRRQRDAFGKYRPLKSVAVDALLEIDPWRLLDPESRPRSFRHPVVEVELAVCVLDAKDQAVGGYAVAGPRVSSPLSRVMSGVMRNATTWEMLPVMLMYCVRHRTRSC